MKLPYGSVASSGTSSTSASVGRCRAASRACALTSAQVARPPSAPLEHPAGRHRLARRVERVLPQEHLVRGVGGVGLVLVDEGRGLVGVLVDIVRGAEHAVGAGLVGGAREDHEVGLVAAVGDVVGAVRVVERIVGLQRDEDRAAAALLDQVEAVVEELAEQREPGIEGRREALVRCHVRDGQGPAVVEGRGVIPRLDGCRVAGSLVRDEVADGAGL